MESTGVTGDLEEVQKVVRREWPEATDELCETIARTGVKACAVNIDWKNPSQLPLQRSKLGGAPYLPRGAEWPKHKKTGDDLGFLCQVNFSEINPNALPDPFPRSGILQWYIDGQDAYGLDFGPTVTTEQVGYRVLYWPEVHEDERKLRSRDELQEINEKAICEDLYPLTSPTSHEFAMSFKETIAYITHCDYRRYDLLSNADRRVDDALCQLAELADVGHVLGGYPYFTQWDPREKNKDGSHKHMELLFQLTSEGTMEWGDGGVANLFIDPNKLKKCDFSDVLYNWDCG